MNGFYNYQVECNKKISHLTTINNLCNGKLEELMDAFGYSEPVKLLLRDNITEFTTKYPELIQQYYTNPILISKLEKEYNKNPFAIMKDVAIGWFTEDYTLYQLNKIEGVVAERNGTEGRELFITANKITNEPDFKVQYKGHTLYIEFITDFIQSWKYTNKVWLRNNKANNLRKDNIFILGRSLIDNTFIFSVAKNLTIYEEYRYENKKGYYYVPEYLNEYNKTVLTAALEWAINPEY